MTYIVYRKVRGVKKILLQTFSKKRAYALKKSCKFKVYVSIRHDERYNVPFKEEQAKQENT